MTTSKINSLQVLRGIAALGVVTHHCLLALTLNRPEKISLASDALVPDAKIVQLGSAGVDLFFVLSGFLMIYISDVYISGRRKVGEFLPQRMIRIWPLYAVFTAVRCFGDVEQYRVTRIFPFDLHLQRLLSFAFVPSFNSKGLLQPILGVGWTLNYETLFYLCFSLILVTGGRHIVVKLILILLSLFCIGLWSPSAVIAGFLGNPIVFEFSFGAVLGSLAMRNGVTFRRGGLWIAGGIILVFSFLYVPFLAVPRPIAFGLPAVMIFTGFLALDRTVVWPAWLRLLGDASYSIYLVHILIVYPIAYRALRTLNDLGMGRIGVIGATAVGVIAAAGAGAICFIVIERPLLRYCQRWYNNVVHRKHQPPLVAQ